MQTFRRTSTVVAVAAAAVVLAPVAHPGVSAFGTRLVDTVDPTTEAAYEWQFAATNLGAALNISPGSASVVVGIIDSGAAEIPDLAGKVDSRWAVSAKGTVRREDHGVDYVGHGSAVASLVAANGSGMQGFGGATHVIAMRTPVLTDVAVAAALAKLHALGARIVNMSFGAQVPEGAVALAAIRKAQSEGMLLIAAAGNSNGPVSHPAADLQSPSGGQGAGLAIGASDVNDQLAFFSNSGENLSLVAPGSRSGPCSGVLVAAPLSDEFVGACYPSFSNGGAWYSYVSGTSFAAPEVAGVAALIWAARPTLSNSQVAGIIRQSARRGDDGWTPTLGCGVLDAGAALALAVSRTDSEWAATTIGTAPCSTTG
jgi:serine protease